ncbi:hypothetical protein I4U23_016437 [Adineta vaga]|nr:hypothetical protein I4U23_016437 [Adineta vaga]
MLVSFYACLVLNLIVVSQQQSTNLILGLGDSFTSNGGSSGSYPRVAANLLNWQARNYAVGGSRTGNIPTQLSSAASVLNNVTHVVFTTGGNDIGLSNSIQEVIVNNNYAVVENKVIALKPQLVFTYKLIKGAVRPHTKIYALPYVDLVDDYSAVSNGGQVSRLMNFFADTIKGAAFEAGIEFIEPMRNAFAGHGMFSDDPYCGGLTGSNSGHPNTKGYYRMGEVVADYLKNN